jgi:hypothetical protein
MYYKSCVTLVVCILISEVKAGGLREVRIRKEEKIEAVEMEGEGNYLVSLI